MAHIHIARTRLAIAEHDCVSNILATLDLATDDEWVAGCAWYTVAHDIASEIALTTVQGAGIIAALSPQIGWADNVAAAGAIAMGQDPAPYGALGPNIEKARRICLGEPPSQVLGGRKVRSFYRNILMPERPGPVTVDRHALNVALEGPGGRADMDKLLQRRGGYQLVAGAYRTAGREAWLAPHQVQAITWLVHRRLLDEQGEGGWSAAHRVQRRNT